VITNVPAVRTSIELDVPVSAVLTSVAVIFCVPTVAIVAEKVPMPFVIPESGGSAARPSVLVKCATPV
jgi:hypothetical protein